MCSWTTSAAEMSNCMNVHQLRVRQLDAKQRMHRIEILVQRFFRPTLHDSKINLICDNNHAPQIKTQKNVNAVQKRDFWTLPSTAQEKQHSSTVVSYSASHLLFHVFHHLIFV